MRVDQAVQDVNSDPDAQINTEIGGVAIAGLWPRESSALSGSRRIRNSRPEDRVNDNPASNDANDEAPRDEVSAYASKQALLSALDRVKSFLTSAWAGVAALKAQSVPPNGEEQRDAELIGATDEREAATLLSRFLASLSVEAEENSRLIHIGFTSSDPQKATKIANKIVEEYIAHQLETKSEGARRAAEWLETRLAELGNTVKSLEQDVDQRRAESGSNSIGIVQQRLGELTTQLVSAQTATAAAGARYDQVRRVLESHGNLDALPAIIGSTSIQALRAKHTELLGRLADLRTIYGENHPQILSGRAELAGIQRSLNGETSTILAGLRNEMESAEMNEAALRQQLEDARREMFQLDQAEASIGQVAQRLKANQDLYQDLLKRYTEAVALRENQQPDARIISPAQIPLKPSHPNFPRIITLSFVGSISLAVFLLVIAERLRQKLQSVEDVERHFGLQVIGVIPDLPRLRRLASTPRDYIQREPLSEFGGAFQRLRALLTLSNNRVVPRTVLVTSCAAAEGKTTIAVCLGIASVSSGQRVLLVDCDFARPQVHRMLDVDNEKGLTDILKGTATLREAVTRAAGSSLSILTVGRSADGAVDLLNSARMEWLLAELKAIFDIIILDSAPVEVSNALILGGLAEKTIFVTRRDWTTHRKASYAIKQLQLYGSDIAGVVFNRAAAATNYAA